MSSVKPLFYFLLQSDKSKSLLREHDSDQFNHDLEYDLTGFLAFENRKCHGLQGSTKPPLLAISTCLLKKKKKISITIYYHLLILLWLPGLKNET